MILISFSNWLGFIYAALIMLAAIVIIFLLMKRPHITSHHITSHHITSHHIRSRPDMLGNNICGRSQLRSAGENVCYFRSEVGSACCDSGWSVRQASYERVLASRISDWIRLKDAWMDLRFQHLALLKLGASFLVIHLYFCLLLSEVPTLLIQRWTKMDG